jgi:hypothetical protein
MNDRERSVGAELDCQLAARYFASAFEHCERLPVRDQRSLLRDISKRLSERLSVVDWCAPRLSGQVAGCAKH